MSVGIGSVLSVCVDPGRNELKLRRFLSNGDLAPEVSASINPGWSKLTKCRSELQSYLIDFKRRLRAADDVNGTYDALVFLFQRGRTLVRKLFDGNTPLVVNEFQSALSRVDSPIVTPKNARPPIVEVLGEPEDLLPIEFLPLLDFSEPPTFGSLADLSKMARRFVGFSAVIRHVVPRKTIPAISIEKLRVMPLKFFRHSGLAGALTEEAYFQRRKTLLQLDGPWPPDNTARTWKELYTSFGSNMWNANRRSDESTQYPPFRIHHFACHCDTSDQNPDLHRIILNAKACGSFAITLHQLFESLSEAMGNDSEPASRPFVFLNACASTSIVPSASLSLPGFFTRNNFIGFLGPETPIPDEWAADFSKGFYNALLQGESLGNACYQAKWRMLQLQRNPAGIFYVLYADPLVQFVPRSCDLKPATRTPV